MSNKETLRRAILAQLESDLAQQTAAAHLARDEAISEESRPESKYDTHSQEAAYLAEGQAKLAREIRDHLAVYATLPLPTFAANDAVALGALVSTRQGRQITRYFLGPRAGGLEFAWDGERYLVITPQSPLGRALVGRRLGDSVVVPGRPALVEVVGLA